MSDMLILAAALDRHAKALETCAVALSSNPPTKTTRTSKAAAETPAETAAAAAAAATQAAVVAPTAPAVATAPAAVTAPASAASAAAGTGPSLQKIADAIIDLANTVSREAAVEILHQFGAEKVPQLKPQDFPAILIAVAAKKNPPATAASGLM